jgi:hypothetical protein
LKQNLIPSWPWLFRHTSCISDFRCKTKYTSKKCCLTLGLAYLAVRTYVLHIEFFSQKVWNCIFSFSMLISPTHVSYIFFCPFQMSSQISLSICTNEYISDPTYIKFLNRHVFKYKHTKWSRWCITASLNYKNTMINRITMEIVACLRSKCHLKQNLIPSWPVNNCKLFEIRRIIGQKITRTGNTAKYASPSVKQHFLLVYFVPNQIPEFIYFQLTIFFQASYDF